MVTKYKKKTDDPFIDWLVKTSVVNRTVWVIKSQLYRLELTLTKNNFVVSEESRELCNSIRASVSQLIMLGYKHDMETRSYLTTLAKHKFIVAEYVIDFNAKRGRT